MGQERWRELERLYHEALARDPGDRAAFLREACAGDQALHGEVEALLAQSTSGGFLATSAMAPAPDPIGPPEASMLTGRRLGVYQVCERLGAGGMGEVYRARDTRLSREVAIKILPRVFTSDPERLRLFAREARVLASLNHPHIGAIYGLEESAGLQALVLELVEGPTLADRLVGRPLPLSEAMAIARQIADALDYAHERGIVHRDLKPANIKVTSDGMVKVIDFGLATVAAPGSGTEGSQAPTMTVGDTRQGSVQGTPAYMSPEQARGQPVDKRTDIWAFGCVLYEMLAGRAAFAAQTMSDTIVAVLEREPSWSGLPASTPPGVVNLMRRCLEKNRKLRLRDIGDASLEIAEIVVARGPEVPSASRAVARGVRWVVALAATALVVGSATWYLKPQPAVSVERAVRFDIVPDEPMAAEGERVVAISPDARRVAFVGSLGGRQQLFVRDVDQFDARPVRGTEGASSPVFSPDGDWLAFVADQSLKKVPIAGGSPQVLCEFGAGVGISWESDDRILFNPGRANGIWSVSAQGGAPAQVTAVGPGENEHNYPAVLPGGRMLLYTAQTGGVNQLIYVQSLESGERHVVARGTGARYLPSGHLVYVQDGTLFAVRFDLGRLEVSGTPTAILEGIQQAQLGTPQIDFSRTGSIVYVPELSSAREDRLVWVDSDGTEGDMVASAPGLNAPRLAPDGTRVAAILGDRNPGPGVNPGDLWLYDPARNTRSRQSFDGKTVLPVWSPDGENIAFSSTRNGRTGVFVKSLRDERPERQLFLAESAGYPLSWSPDGQWLAIVVVDPKTATDIWVLPVGGTSSPHPLVQTRFREAAPTFSPDGRWVAYVSDQSGRDEVYMRPVSGEGTEWTLSSEGGSEPVWARGSNRVFYRLGNRMMAVDVQIRPDVVVGRPRLLFDRAFTRSTANYPNFDVTPDGSRFLMVKGAAGAVTRLNLVLHWTEELKQLVPVH